MHRKRNGLVSISAVSAELRGPVNAIREATPQALHHFTRFDGANDRGTNRGR